MNSQIYPRYITKTQTSIHPSIFYTRNASVGSQGGWSLSQRSLGERRGTPWTGQQSITGQKHRHFKKCWSYKPKKKLNDARALWTALEKLLVRVIILFCGFIAPRSTLHAGQLLSPTVKGNNIDLFKCFKMAFVVSWRYTNKLNWI